MTPDGFEYDNMDEDLFDVDEPTPNIDERYKETIQNKALKFGWDELDLTDNGDKIFTKKGKEHDDIRFELSEDMRKIVHKTILKIYDSGETNKFDKKIYNIENLTSNN
jgi:hypothetical protein